MNNMAVSAPHLLKMHGSIICQRNETFQPSNKVIASMQVHRLRTQALSGLRASTPILGSTTIGLGFDSKMKDAMLANRGKRSRCVARAMFPRFTDKAEKVLLVAVEEVKRLKHDIVGTEEILLGLIYEGTSIGAKVLKSAGINMKKARIEVEKLVGRGIIANFNPTEISFSPRAKRLLELSLEEARKFGHNYISPEHLVLGLLSERESIAALVLKNLGVDPNEIRKQVLQMMDEYEEPAAYVGGNSADSMIILQEYGINLTKLAEEGKLDHAVGRKEQIERIIQILSRRTKNNPCIIGEPGFAKTSIVEGLAVKIADGFVPKTLEGKQVISLDLCSLVNGSKNCGEFEGRLQRILEEAKESKNVILFINNVHLVFGAVAGGIDVAKILRPALARGEIQCIGATTPRGYKGHIEKDPTLAKIFQAVEVPTPTVNESIQILLRGIRERSEVLHKLPYIDETLALAMRLLVEYRLQYETNHEDSYTDEELVAAELASQYIRHGSLAALLLSFLSK